MFIQVNRSTLERTEKELVKGLRKLEGIRGSLRSQMNGLTASTRYRSDVDGAYRQIDGLLEALEDDMAWLSAYTSRKEAELGLADESGKHLHSGSRGSFDASAALPSKSVLGSFFGGFFGALSEDVKWLLENNAFVSLYNMIDDPQSEMDKFAARIYMATHPWETAEQVMKLFVEDFNQRIINGDVSSRSEYTGEVVYEGVITFVPVAGGMSKLLKVFRKTTRVEQAMIASGKVKGPQVSNIGKKVSEVWSKMDVKGKINSLVGDPIHTGTGAQIMDQPLLMLHGAHTWPFELHYNSLLLQRGVLGIGWTHNYEMKLDIGSDALTLWWNASRRHAFAPGEGGVYRSADEAVRFDRMMRDETGYTLTLRETEEQYRFSLSGELQWKRSETGLRLLAEHEEGRLVRLIDELSGQTLRLTYNGQGLLENVSDGVREIAMAYNDAQQLIRYTEPAGHEAEMRYTEEGQVLEGWIGGRLHFRNTYDERGCIVAQEDGAGQVMKLAYDTDSLPGYIVTTVIDRSGREEVFVHDERYRLIERRRPGSRVRYAYNEAGQLLSQTTDSGEADEHDEASRETVALAYDEEGRRIAVIDALGRATRYTYGSGARPLTMTNALGQTTVYDYDAEGRLVGITRPDGEKAGVVYDERGLRMAAASFGGAATRYSYGEDGRLQAVEDAEGRRTELSYDAAGRVTAMTDASGAVTQHEYDANDNLTAVTDPLGRRWRLSYDAFDRLVRREAPSGAATDYRYGVHLKPERIIDALGRETVIAYDGEGRVVQVTDPAGVTQRYAYDADGRLAAMADGHGHRRTFRYDAADRLQEVRDALGAAAQTIAYDKAGNPVAVIDAAGARTTYKYNALRQLESVTDALGRETTFAYDAAMRLTETQEAGAAVYRQRYEASGLLASHTDANGNETQYRYDRSGALIEEKRADGGVSTYAYEARGLLSSRTSPSGQTTQLAYDAAGQLTEAADAAGTIRYGYDADGRVTHVEENGARSEREYDAAGQLIRYTDAGGHTIRYAYDGGGRLSVLTYPDGRQVEYRYDAAGRLSEVKDWAGRLTRYRYDENGRLIRTERPNRTVEVRDYDAAGRLRLLQDLVKPGIPLQQRRYAYNAIGQIEREDDKQYRYDELKRLVHCASPGRRRWYAYDAGGNLTETGEELQETQTVQSLHYGKDNRLRSCGDYPVEMDREGNLLYATDGKEMDAYRYDARNRLIQSVKASYGYDAENRRIRLDEEGRKTQYVWDPSETLDGLDHMLMELDSEGRVRAYYIYGHGLIGREDAAGNYRAYLYDARGSTTLLTDETGQVTDRYTYGPYGEEERHEGQTKQPYRYNGRDGVMTDADGIVYMRARYYHTKLKRFLNRDVVRGALTDGQTFNRYAYVNGDPVNYIDPLGLFKDWSEKWKYAPWGNKGKNFEGTGDVTANGNKVMWGSWSDYPKVTANGQEYAQVGDRLYSRHAVDRMQPSGKRYSGDSQIVQAGGAGKTNDYGRSVSPNYVEDVIQNTKPVFQENGNLSYTSGSLQVITNPQGAVVTIITK